MALYKIQNFQPKFNESFLFDNNIWVLLFCPIANSELKKQKAYSLFLKDIKNKNNAIFINSLILSEFCNSWLRLEFNIWRKNFSEPKDLKKDFKSTQRFKDTISEIKNAVRQILSATEKAPDSFNSINIDSILNNFGNCDLNDAYYIELAKTNKWKIVTDDSDFLIFQSDLDIITA